MLELVPTDFAIRCWYVLKGKHNLVHLLQVLPQPLWMFECLLTSILCAPMVLSASSALLTHSYHMAGSLPYLVTPDLPSCLFSLFSAAFTSLLLPSNANFGLFGPLLLCRPFSSLLEDVVV